ncbi:glycine oxidase [Bryocella elongata]|uniref:Glycine oxidase n=1 Tax=Bryocella elongata TaxID=863522 RepID=A0A1H5ZHH5_9BACT|nr:FAD-dependent oxidoreductase [Bryocella elongata]SEG35692.1 glycine oxidase [Bryocella elongata]
METEHGLSFDTIVIGGGLIGLSVALELHARGAQVLVLERDQAFRQASGCAVGMLAVVDVHNPPPLHPLSRYSESLYPAFLDRVSSLSGEEVPFQTETTVHYLDEGGVERLHEWSVDPQHLSDVMIAAVRATSIVLREGAELADLEDREDGTFAVLRSGERIHAKNFVFATGAWALPESLRAREGLIAAGAVTPLKGQMLRVAVPPSLAGLKEVHRRGACYAVPRTKGPYAGTVILGTTVEATGFDDTVDEEGLATVRSRIAELVPAFADEAASPVLEFWAGIRPMTADGLPILAASSRPGVFFAMGHGRNGIQLAPATAMILADLVEQKQPAIDLSAFSPNRFSQPIPPPGARA